MNKTIATTLSTVFLGAVIFTAGIFPSCGGKSKPITRAEKGAEKGFGVIGIGNKDNAKDASSLGAKYDRPEVFWKQLQPNGPEGLNTQDLDTAYDLLQQKGIEPIISLRTKTLSWATSCDIVAIPCPSYYTQCPHEYASCPPKDLNASGWGEHGYSESYYHLFEKTLNHLHETSRPIHYIVIENEINTLTFWHGTQEQYLQLRATAFKAVKDIRAATGFDVRIVDNGLANDIWGIAYTVELFCFGGGAKEEREQNAADFATRFAGRMRSAYTVEELAEKIGDCSNLTATKTGQDYLLAREMFTIDPHLGESSFDFMSYHFYYTWDTQKEIIDYIKSEMARNGYSKPIIHSEGGYMDALRFYTDSNPDVVKALKQDVADELIKNHVIAFTSGVVIWTWHPLHEANEGSLGSEYKGLTLSDGSHLPAYKSYQTMIEKLGNFSTAETIDFPGIHAYRFMVNNSPVYILWSLSATTIDFSAFIPGDVRVTRTDGSAKNVPGQAIPLSESPIFLEPS